MLPHDLLPIKRPDEYEPTDTLYFYTHVAKPLIPDVIRIMENGIPIDLDKVIELENVVNTVLEESDNVIRNNPLIQEFIVEKNKQLKQFKKESIIIDIDKYRVEFKLSNATHRRYAVEAYLASKGLIDEYGKDSDWSMKDIRQLNSVLNSTYLERLLNKIDISKDPITIAAMNNLAKDKASIAEKKKLTKVDEIKVVEFNPASTTQLSEFFEYYDIESENTTPAGKASWNRASLEALLKEIESQIEE